MRHLFSLLLTLGLAVACSRSPEPDAGAPPTEDAGGGEMDAGPPDAGHDAGVDAGPGCEGPPGLYEPGDCTVVSAGLRRYVPQFVLWADGAEKERYIYLPPGEQIDTTNPDLWVFPVGTRVYKTFMRDGLRLETRVLEKTSPGTGVGSWDVHVYAWNMDQDGVVDVTNAAEPERTDVLGTTHDIPSGSDCLRCHIGQNGHDMVNGFSAFQLHHAAAGVSLEDLVAEGRLSDPFPTADAVVPGDESTRAALGYLHTNCGNCHRPGGDPAAALRMFFMRLQVGENGTPEATSTYMTGVNQLSTITFGSALCRFKPGDAANSVAYHRMSSRDPGTQMPPLATEVVDGEGQAILQAWLDGLTIPPDPRCNL